jgi:hypothetical protein
MYTYPYVVLRILVLIKVLDIDFLQNETGYPKIGVEAEIFPRFSFRKCTAIIILMIKHARVNTI